MQIATFINDKLEVTSFYEEGVVCLFDNHLGSWECRQQIPLKINMEMGLSELKRALRKIGTQMEGCEVFLIAESKGVLHVFLEELGFRTWKSTGTLFEQLDNVAQKDAESVIANAQTVENMSTNQGPSCGAGCGRSSGRALGSQGKGLVSGRTIPKPLAVGDGTDGYYQMNLAEVLNSDPDLNSKQVLIPFLQETAFKKLVILCDHTPRWLAKELEHLNVRIESEVVDASGHGVQVIICPNK